MSITVIDFTVGYRGRTRLAGDEIPLDNGKLRATEGRKATGPEKNRIAGLPKVGTPEQLVSVAGSFFLY